MSYNKTLWVNTDERKLVKSFQSNSEANKPQFTQGDLVPLKVILLESTGNQGVPFRNIKVTTETLKLALGRVDQAPASGTFTLTFGADTTASLAYNISAADLSTALNGLTSITTAGGVTVSGVDGGPFTIAFDAVGAQAYITGDLALLEPASVLNNVRKQTGDGSTKEIQVIRLAEGVLALQDTFSAIAAPVATISTLTAGGSGANEIQQLVIDQECIGGLIALTFGAKSTSFNYGATADEVKESLEGNTNIGAGNIAVTKVSDTIYTFEFIGTLADANQAEFTVDGSGLEGFSGFSASLDLDNYSVESFLAGSANKECYIELELTAGSDKTTLCTSSAKIINDVINSATAAPPLSPSITFVESVNGSSGVVTLDPDDLDDTSTTNKFATAAQLAKIDHLTVTQAVDLDTMETDVTANNAKVTNATHTGEVTGSTALTVDKTAVSNKTTVSAVAGDFILISDTSDSGNLKKVDADDFLSSGSFPPTTDTSDKTTAYTITAGDIGKDIPIGSGATADFDVDLDVSLCSASDTTGVRNENATYIARLVVSNTGTMTLNSVKTDEYISPGQCVWFKGDTATNAVIVSKTG